MLETGTAWTESNVESRMEEAGDTPLGRSAVGVGYYVVGVPQVVLVESSLYLMLFPESPSDSFFLWGRPWIGDLFSAPMCSSFTVSHTILLFVYSSF